MLYRVPPPTFVLSRLEPGFSTARRAKARLKAGFSKTCKELRVCGFAHHRLKPVAKRWMLRVNVGVDGEAKAALGLDSTWRYRVANPKNGWALEDV